MRRSGRMPSCATFRRAFAKSSSDEANATRSRIPNDSARDRTKFRTIVNVVDGSVAAPKDRLLPRESRMSYRVAVVLEVLLLIAGCSATDSGSGPHGAGGAGVDASHPAATGAGGAGGGIIIGVGGGMIATGGRDA